MTDPRLLGHALVALGLAAVLAGVPPEPAATPAFVPLQPFDEQFVALPTDDADSTATTAAPPDPASGLFEA